MKIRPFVAAVSIGFFILLAQSVAVEAAEVKVMCLTPMEDAMRELGATFERTTSHKLVIAYEVAPVLKRRIDAGEIFDVAILLRPLIEDSIKQGKIVPGTRAEIARSGMGVGVRAGAPKPDISSVAALKSALRNAKSVAYSKEGASGVYFLGLIERLGIANEIKPKLKPTPAEAFSKVVPSGEAEMIVVPISVIMAPGMDLVGPVPSELQTYFAFTAGVSASAKEVEAAKALVHFLMAPAALPVLRAKGLEPGAPR